MKPGGPLFRLTARMIFGVCGLCSILFAQGTATPQTRAEQIQQQRLETLRTPVEPDNDIVERAVYWAYRNNLTQIFSTGWNGITPVFGGMINNSGLAFGAQYLRAGLLNGNLNVRTSARLSTNGFQLFDFETGLPRLADGKAYLDVYLRRRNYGQVDYYGPGPNSREEGRSYYRLEDFQADLSTGLRPTRWLRVGVAGGYYRPNVGPSSGPSLTSTERLYSPRLAPGIDRQTDYLRGGGLVQVDYRDNPYGPRAGGQYYARFDYYKDRDLKAFSFRRLTAEAQQFIPFFNKKRVVVLRAKTEQSFENPNQRVPFYLQPSLGSSDDLRGFRAFRFYGNNSVVYTAEWRWEVYSNVDAALFVDAGKVANRPSQLTFSNLEKSYGAGLRFRAPLTGAVIGRLDAGFSNEGFRVWLVFQDLFATPQIRTGRELSPPPGRLP